MEDSTPILVGAGQFIEKDVPPEKALPPVGIAGEAAKAALADSGIGDRLSRHIDTVVSIRIILDSTNRPRLEIPFGRAENPPRSVAQRIGANPVSAIYGNVGGNTPQMYINEVAERISNKEIDVALIAGSEAIKTAQLALRSGLDLDWDEEDTGSMEDRGLGEELITPHEFAHGIGVPVQSYPLFENAFRAQQGNSIELHMQQLGALFEPFSKIAARNPFAFFGKQRSAEELITVTPENRFICFPYPKWMNAMDGVNQGAAVIMTSVGKAKELAINPQKWIFLHGSGEANDKLTMSKRVNYYSAPALKLNVRKALAMAGKKVDEIDYFDIYSCFPSAVEIACNELGLAHNDPRGLTVTGGLPFFGGPGNNYSLHAVAAMILLLRADRTRFGLVTANGGYLSKHATGIYSATPWESKWRRENPADYQREIDETPSPEFSEIPNGRATIETYTICFNKGVAERGIIVGRLADSGQRFVANTIVKPELLQGMIEKEQVGRTGTVSHSEGMNTFIPF